MLPTAFFLTAYLYSKPQGSRANSEIRNRSKFSNGSIEVVKVPSPGRRHRSREISEPVVRTASALIRVCIRTRCTSVSWSGHKSWGCNLARRQCTRTPFPVLGYRRPYSRCHFDGDPVSYRFRKAEAGGYVVTKALFSARGTRSHDEDSTPNQCGRLSTNKTKAIPPFTENSICRPATSGQLADLNWLEEEVIEPSTSPWSSPSVIVWKEKGHRF
jgi:hypothetical protein